MKKRLFSILTALALCLTLLPTAALAASGETITAAQDMEKNVRSGFVLDFASPDTEPTLSMRKFQDSDEPADLTAPTHLRYRTDDTPISATRRGLGAVYYLWDNSLSINLTNATIDAGPAGSAIALKNPPEKVRIILLTGPNSLTGGFSIDGEAGASTSIYGGSNDAYGIPSLTVDYEGDDAAFSDTFHLFLSNCIVNIQNHGSGAAISCPEVEALNGISLTATSQSGPALSTNLLIVDSNATLTAKTGSSGSLLAASASKTVKVTVRAGVTVRDGGTLNLSGGTTTIKDAFTVESTGTVNVAQDTTLIFDNSDPENGKNGTLSNSGTFVNNGVLQFPSVPDFASLKLSGTGIVQIPDGSGGFTLYSNTGSQLNSIGDLDLSGDISVLPDGVTWDSDRLTLTNVYVGNITLPARDISVIVDGSVIVNDIRGTGSVTLSTPASDKSTLYAKSITLGGGLTLKDALSASFGTVSAGSLSLAPASVTANKVSLTGEVQLNQSSTLTINGSGTPDDFTMGGIGMDPENCEIVLNNAGTSSSDQDAYDDYLPGGCHVGGYDGNWAIYEGNASAGNSPFATNLTLSLGYSVTYDANGGQFLHGGIRYSKLEIRGSSSQLVPYKNPTKSGYKFEGWEITSPAGTSFDWTDQNVQSKDFQFQSFLTEFNARKIIVTAQWTPIFPDGYTLPYTINVSGSNAPSQTFTLAAEFASQAAAESLTLSGNTITTSAGATGTLHFNGTSSEIFTALYTGKGTVGGIYVYQKPVTGDGWTSAAEGYYICLLVDRVHIYHATKIGDTWETGKLLDTTESVVFNNTYTYTPAPGGSGGGSSSSGTYAVTAPGTQNGSVTASPKQAEKGDTVTLTVAPDKGYTLETLTVLDQNGNELELTDKGNGKFTFKMPAGKVEVKATFMEDNSMLNFFVDVPASAYFYDAVLWAAENGITGGVDAVHFDPYAPCTRAQIVTFLYRWAVAQGLDVSVGEDTNILSYSDAFDVPEYAIPALQWACGAGILQGSDGSLMPNQPCTRAQAVAFLFRFAAASGLDFVTLQELVSGFGDAAQVPGYALSAFNWALAGGIVQGNNGDLMPNQTCTRAQIVTFLYRTQSAQ